MSLTIYEAAGGRQAFIALAHAWHARCLADPIVSHAFSHGYHPQHSERLAAYWAEALGGPSDYTASMGNQSGVSNVGLSGVAREGSGWSGSWTVVLGRSSVSSQLAPRAAR